MPRLTESANISYSMYIELLFKIKYVCRFPKGYGTEQALTQLAVKILFGDSTGFNEMRWTIILPEKQSLTICIVYGLDKN